MKKSSIFLALCILVVSPMASAQTLDELARIVREAAMTETRINQQRELEDTPSVRGMIYKVRHLITADPPKSPSQD